MNEERGVKNWDGTPGSLADNPKLFTDTCKGQVLLVRQSYVGARLTVKDTEIDPDRIIEIAIGHAEDWTPIVCIVNSLRDCPIEIVGGSEAALREAVQAIHGEIFHDWPLTKEQIDDLFRRQFSDEGPP